MDIAAVSASVQSAGASHSLLKGAMENTAASVLTLLGGMPSPQLAPREGSMDIRV